MPGEVSSRMDKYVADTIEYFTEYITAVVVKPSADHMFNVSLTATLLK